MPLRSHHKTIILSIASQLPILLLLAIFFRIPGLPMGYRVMAVITVVIEASLLSELIGNIVQKVRADDDGIRVREVFDRKRLPWEKVRAVRQVVLSPMRSDVRLPAKLFLVKADEAPGLQSAKEWWRRRGPLANGRSGMADLIGRYDRSLRRELEGWFVLWAIEYRRPQAFDDVVEVEYLALDGRERGIVDDLRRFGGRRTRSLSLVNATYPSFVRRHGGKYASDRAHVWETVE